MKLTRFLIADNPMVDGSRSAIIHTIDPHAIIELIEGQQEFQSPYKNYLFININGIPEAWTLKVHHLFTTEFDNEQHHLIVNKLLDRAWHWYMAYMNWQDEQVK